MELSAKKKLFWFALVIFSLAFLEIFSRLVSFWVDHPRPRALSEIHRKYIKRLLTDQTRYIIHHPVLGWAIKPNGHIVLPDGNEYRANSQGIRADIDYTVEPLRNKIRVAALGDSFTHGDQVSNEETWEAYLGEMNPGLEVLNLGVGGYGVDQAYLRYRELGARFSPQIVLIGFMSADISRHVNTFRPFFYQATGIPLSKPRFALEGGSLAVIDNPMPSLSDYSSLLKDPESHLPRLGEYDYFYQRMREPAFWDIFNFVWLAGNFLAASKPQKIYESEFVYNTGSEAYKISARLIDEFYAAVEQDGSKPVILLFPKDRDWAHFLKTGRRVYEPLIKHFDEKGYRYVDLLKGLAEYGAGYSGDDLFIPHYTPVSNQIVARQINEYLME